MNVVNLAISIVALVVSIAAAFAAVGLWRAAKRANDTTAKMAAIDRDRRHEELTPGFEITCKETATAPGQANLEIRLVSGPRELDEVTATILDEAGQDHWTGGFPADLSPEQAATFVWGPWEFRTQASEQIKDFRTSKPRLYSRVDGKDWDRLPMCETRPGAWMTGINQATWKREHPGPLRLNLTCRRDGDDPWQVSYEISVQKLASVASAAGRKFPPMLPNA